MSRSILIVLLMTTLGACTNRQAFDALKANKLNDCYRQPLPTQEQCIEEVRELDYQSYRRQRDEVIDKEAN